VTRSRRARLNDSRDIESRIVWLLGSPRSGSTWLLQLLARLTGGAQVREPLIGAHLGLSVGGLLGVAVSEDPLLIDSMTHRSSYFFADDAVEAWEPPLRTLLVDRFRLEARRHEATSGRPADPIIVKDPWGSVGAPVLLRTLPRSRLLFLIRDGRDVVDSLLDGEADGWITKTLGARIDGAPTRERAIEHHSQMWVRSIEAVHRAFGLHPPSLRLLVKYESLNAEAETELRRIVRWLGRDDLLDQVEQVAEDMQFSNYPDSAKGTGKFLRAASPGLWRERFSMDERMRLQEMMRPTLEKFGYD
jgi:hypothetical protein